MNSNFDADASIMIDDRPYAYTEEFSNSDDYAWQNTNPSITALLTAGQTVAIMAEGSGTLRANYRAEMSSWFGAF